MIPLPPCGAPAARPVVVIAAVQCALAALGLAVQGIALDVGNDGACARAGFRDPDLVQVA